MDIQRFISSPRRRTFNVSGRAFFCLVACAMIFLQAGITMSQTPDSQIARQYQGHVNAPDFPTNLQWLNTERPISLRELRGKLVLLDFWTYCCINCMHILPELKRLEKKYANQLIVIGVHSAKFANEKGTENIRQAILRYEIDHPVLNDSEREVWEQYAVNSWPSLVLINPKGKIVAVHRGEMTFDLFDPVMENLVAYFRSTKELRETPLSFRTEKSLAPPSLLSYPGKVLADEKSHRLFISDSNHNRIIVTSLEGQVQDVIGDGSAGRRDGSFGEAELNHPQGVALEGETLYICDTENHLIRKADLKARTVTTVLGKGEQARFFDNAGQGTGIALNSPWDAVVHNNKLYIAMAGPHQLWVADLKTWETEVYAGSGRENHVDGKLRSAALAQPSGITTDGKSLFFADSEISSIRVATLPPGDQVSTLAGEGLFDFGDRDSGTFDENGKLLPPRLQHPLGVSFIEGRLYVADTYNHKIKVINLKSKLIETYSGDGKRGIKDGERRKAQFNEPGGISATSKIIFVADTNNHLIRQIDPATKQVTTLELRGLEKLTLHMVRKFRGRVIEVPKQNIAPGTGSVSLSFNLPAGFKYNPGAPFYVAFQSSDDKMLKITAIETARNFTDSPFPMEIPIEAISGNGTIQIDAVIYFCNDTAQKVCLMDSVRVLIPLEIRAASESRVKVEVMAKAKGLAN
jgi:thiol-disulfide isomerase/thioredoxin